MNNNQDNINNQNINNTPNINPNTYNNYPNGMHQQPMLNVIPGMQQNVNNQQIQNESFQNQNIENNNQPNVNQESGNFIRNINVFNDKPTPPPMTTMNNNITEEDDEIRIDANNKFINSNIDATNSLNQLNIEDEYNDKSAMYLNDPTVQANLQNTQPENKDKKNTITITGEGKVFLIIIAALLIFTFVMPYIFDFIRDIKY